MLPIGHCRQFFMFANNYYGRSDQYVLIVCVSADSTRRPYFFIIHLTHYSKNVLDFVLPDSFEPIGPLQCSNKNDKINCWRYTIWQVVAKHMGHLMMAFILSFGGNQNVYFKAITSSLQLVRPNLTLNTV